MSLPTKDKVLSFKKKIRPTTVSDSLHPSFVGPFSERSYVLKAAVFLLPFFQFLWAKWPIRVN